MSLVVTLFFGILAGFLVVASIAICVWKCIERKRERDLEAGRVAPAD